MGFGAAIGAAIGEAAPPLYGQGEQWRQTKRFAQKKHQWTVADLKAAGLNPILSMGGMNSGNMSGASLSPMDLAGAVSTATGVKKLGKEIKNLEETNALIKDQRKGVQASTAKTEAEADVIKSKGHYEGLKGDVFKSIRENTKPKDITNMIYDFFGDLGTSLFGGTAKSFQEFNKRYQLQEMNKGNTFWKGGKKK